jgi:hypothetical protein
LICIADDHGLPGPKERTEGRLGRHLRRLVDDEQIEMDRALRNVLCDRQRRHHPARFQFEERPSCSQSDIPDWKEASFLAYLVVQQCHLGPGGFLADAIAGGGLRRALQSSTQLLAGDSDDLPVQLRELTAKFIQLCTAKLGQSCAAAREHGLCQLTNGERLALFG